MSFPIEKISYDFTKIRKGILQVTLIHIESDLMPLVANYGSCIIYPQIGNKQPPTHVFKLNYDAGQLKKASVVVIYSPLIK